VPIQDGKARQDKTRRDVQIIDLESIPFYSLRYCAFLCSQSVEGALQVTFHPQNGDRNLKVTNVVVLRTGEGEG
jgi:hypothetical protein